MLSHTKWVWKHSRSKLAARLVMLCLADHANKKGQSWPSVGTIASECGVSDRSVQESIRTLMELGELEIKLRAGIHGVNIYQITLKDPEESAPPKNLHPEDNDGSPPKSLPKDPEESAPKATIEATIKSPSEEGFKFAAWFRKLQPEDLKLSDGWQKSWAKTYDDLLRLDGRKKQQVVDVCLWATSDSFWTTNFRTPSKLRHRDPQGIFYFDVFAAKMNAPKPKTSKANSLEGIKMV